MKRNSPNKTMIPILLTIILPTYSIAEQAAATGTSEANVVNPIVSMLFTFLPLILAALLIFLFVKISKKRKGKTNMDSIGYSSPEDTVINKKAKVSATEELERLNDIGKDAN